MKKILASFLSLIALLAVTPSTSMAQQKNIEREELESAFAHIRKSTNWKVEGELLWGFFFTAPAESPLIAASKILETMGYRVVSIHPDDEKKDWWLHVERIEIHTVDSLNARNQQLTKFAADQKLGTYDGWDVGQVLDVK
jgi:Regulator of ribonuclease activity B